MKNLIKIGTVESINYKNGTARLLYEELDNSLSFDLPIIANEYNMPNVGDQVVAIFLSQDNLQGFIVGRPFSDDNMPSNGKENIIRKDYDEDNFIEYDKNTETLTINVKQIVINGNLVQGGRVDGSR